MLSFCDDTVAVRLTLPGVIWQPSSVLEELKRSWPVGVRAGGQEQLKLSTTTRQRASGWQGPMSASQGWRSGSGVVAAAAEGAKPEASVAANPVGAAEEGSSPGAAVEAVLGVVDAGSVETTTVVEAASVVVVTTPSQDGSSGQMGAGQPLKVIFCAG